MQGRRPSRRVRALVVLAAALAVLAATVATTAVGQTDPATFETEGDRLLVTVEKDALGNDTTITLRVAGTERGPYRSTSENADSFTYAVPFAELVVEGESMADVLVVAESGGTDLGSERLTLQHVSLGDPGGATFTDAGTLRLPVERAVGVPGTVTLAVGDDGTAPASLRANGTMLEIGRTELGDHAAAFRGGPVEFAVEPAEAAAAGSGSVTVDVAALAAEATTVDRAPDGAGLVLVSPLVFDGPTYQVEAVDGDGARFAAATTAESDRRLAFGGEALADADAVNVTVRRGGERVLVTGQRSLGGSNAPLSATIDAGGNATSVTIPDLESAVGTLATPLRAAYVNTSDRRVALNASAVDVSGTVVDFSATDYAVAANGSYGFLLVGADGTTVRAVTSGDGESAIVASPGDGGDGSGPEADPDDGGGLVDAIASVLTNRYVLIGIVVVALLGVLAVTFLVWTGRLSFGRSRGTGGGGGSQAGGQGGGGQPPSAPQVGVRVVEEATGAPIDVDGEVLAEPARGSTATRRSETLSGGRASLRLDPGVWRLTARGGGVNVAEDVRVSAPTTVTLAVPPNEVAIDVRDEETDEPVPGAAVGCRPDAGESRTERTDEAGRVAFDLSPDADSIEVAVRHDRYEETSERTDVGDTGGSGTLRLRPLTGSVTATVTVDGRPTAGVPVEVVARDSYVKRHRRERHEATTDSRGEVSVDGLLAGTYEARVAFPEDRRQFGDASAMVEVRDGEATGASLDVAFRYGLSPAQRNRIAEIRERVESLSAASGRDVVVPRYYGSVVAALLDVVEGLPDEGHRFAGAEVETDRLVEALLDAAEASTDAVSTAMASKRNGDLFAACADLPDRQVAWDGSFDVATLFDLLATGRGEQSRRLQERLAAIEDRIGTEQGELSTLSPAREPLDEVADLVREARRSDDPAAVAAATFAADGLLDAVEGVLDHEVLRKRLQRTVF